MVTLPTFLPIAEAARKYRLDEASQQGVVETGAVVVQAQGGFFALGGEFVAHGILTGSIAQFAPRFVEIARTK